jgi:ABC-type sugar transport system substrate-binding protein
MGKNGGKPTDTILTLEEALKRFKRKRDEAGTESRAAETASDSNVHHVDFSARAEPQSEETTTRDFKPADDNLSASVSAQRDDLSAGMPADCDFVAVIEGVPRTFEELERLAAAEKAYDEDFPETTLESAEETEADDAEAGAMDLVALAANRHARMRDYAFTAMGTALMVLVAVMATRAPIVNDHPTLMVAQTIATPALKASSAINTDDLITTLVIVPDADGQQASARPALKSDVLEAKIKDTLKLRAFTDIGVSVSNQGDAYLAGEVYSLSEARKIAHIVHSVNGVNRVHFLHPDVRTAQGPAFFGVTTASAPAVWGAKVKAVLIGSPADKAGIKSGDVISEFDGKTIPDGKAFNELLAQYAPGQRVQFRVWHDGQPEYLVARLGEVTTVASR